MNNDIISEEQTADDAEFFFVLPVIGLGQKHLERDLLHLVRNPERVSRIVGHLQRLGKEKIACPEFEADATVIGCVVGPHQSGGRIRREAVDAP